MKMLQLIEAPSVNINLYDKSLTELPDDLPREIEGWFTCSRNALTTLRHSPIRVGENFDCFSNHLTSLKYGPIEVGGDFSCSSNRLTNLEFCPNIVGGKFACNNNQLTSLKHCPNKVNGDFYAYSNKLSSMDACPSEVLGDFFCHGNEITSLKDIHKRIKKITKRAWLHYNPIKSHILGLMLIDIGGEIMTRLGNGKDVDEILNKWKNQGRKGVLGCQRELISAGYKELAQL